MLILLFHSAVLCACFRLAVTIDYSFAEDWTYAISPLALWCLAELTCLFVVFCVPGVPKAFQLFKSWSHNRSSQRSSNKATKGTSPWPSANSNSIKPISSKYHPIDDNGMRLQNLNLRSANTPMDSRDEHGILRTMEFSATGEARHGEHSSSPYQHQEAWASSNHQMVNGGGNPNAYNMA